MPFKPDPVSFAKYMSQLKWNNGTRVKFENLSQCFYHQQAGGYGCDSGFATISDPRGTQICKARVLYAPYNPGGISYETSSCRWK